MTDTESLEMGEDKISEANVRTVLPRSFDLRYYGDGGIMQVLSWMLLVVNVLTFAVLMVKMGNVLFTNFVFTYDLPDSSPGTLLSTRFSFYYWFIILPIFFDIIVIILAGIRIAIPWDEVYGVLHTIAAVLAVIMSFSAGIAMSILGNTANTASNPLNPANSEFYCAANAHVSDPSLTLQGCPMPTNPYTITVAPGDLKWNSVFTNNYAFTWAILFLEIVQVIIGVVVSSRHKIIFSHVIVWSDESNTHENPKNDFQSSSEYSTVVTTSQSEASKAIIVKPTTPPPNGQTYQTTTVPTEPIANQVNNPIMKQRTTPTNTTTKSSVTSQITTKPISNKLHSAGRGGSFKFAKQIKS